MNNHRKIFSHGLNADDDFSVIAPGQWVNAENIRTFTTDSGATGRIENVGGTISLFNQVPGGANRCIGGCVDEAKKRIVWLNWNSNGNHGIYCFDKSTATGYKVLMNADVTGGLNFSRYAYIHSCFIANGNLYWTNGTQNQPRRINIEAGIKAYATFDSEVTAYTLPVSQSVISWVRKPGAFPPSVVKVYQTDPAINFNFIKEAAFQFCYRYNFRDNEVSTLSPLSKLINYNTKDDLFNRVDVTIPLDESIEQDVQSIDLVVRYTDSSYFIIKSWNRGNDAAAIANHNNGSLALSFKFYNDKIGEALDGAYKVKPFDSLPKYAETCELAKNRAILANYTEGYDTPKETSLTINRQVLNIDTGEVATVTGDWYEMHFNLGGAASGKYYYKVIRTTTSFFSPISPATYYYWTIEDTVPPYPDTLASTDLTFVGSDIDQMIKYFRNEIPHGNDPGVFVVSRFVRLSNMGEDSTITTSGSSTSFLGTAFKSGTSYDACVNFFDEYQRPCGARKITNGAVTFETVTAATTASVSSAGNVLTVPAASLGAALIGDIMRFFGSTYFETGEYTISDLEADGTNVKVTLIETIPDVATDVLWFDVMRKITDNPVIAIPDAKLTGDYTIGLNWSLSNNRASFEIPEWAYYYSIGLTKCLTTRFFVDGAGLASYAKRSDTNDLTLETSFSDSVLLLIDVSGLESFGMGYTFNEGDIIKIIVGSTEYTTAITGTEGKYVLAQPINIGTLSPSNVVFEIYTPYKPTDSELYFEQGEMYAVADPGTDSRAYTIVTGVLSGDVTIFKRSYSTSTFVAEAMSPNDKLWRNWNVNAGRPNTIDTIGQVTKTGGRRFSNTFIEGTKTNGLSSFETLNGDILDVENGAIRKLQLANKVQFDGTVLLNICENEAVSTYLGETELFDTQGSTSIVKTNGFFGSSKSLKGGLGTSNPESVFEQNGLVFWWDTRNGCAVQYSSNGLFPISKNKFTRPANLFSKKFNQLTPDEIITNLSNPYIIGGFDPHHGEVLFSIPKTDEPPKGYLEDYPDRLYPYDIYDGLKKTIMYKSEADVWLGSMTFETEKFISMDNELYGFKNGSLYIHNQNTTNFYGTEFKSRLMYSNNPGAIHTFLSIGLESNKKPSFVHFRTEDPYVQSSDLILSDFVVKEGVISASLLRDRLSPNASGDYFRKQITGDRLFGKALLVMLEYEFVNDPTLLQLRLSNVGNTIRSGTLINAQ